MTNKDCKYDLMINSFNITLNRPKYWKSWDTETWLLSDAVIASCSAPTYFMPHKIDGWQFIDGGVDTNNLCLSAYIESKIIYPDCSTDLTVYGTGEFERSIDIKKGGLMEWSPHIIDVFMTTNNKSPVYLLKEISKLYPDDNIVFLDKQLGHSVNLDAVKEIEYLRNC